jgi:nucleoside-diphosphate-sugar epimerase
MGILITGANGFIGRALTHRLRDAGERLILLDIAFAGPERPETARITGSIADPGVLERAFAEPIDLVFHLASIPGGMAEQDYDLGRRINLDAMVQLLEAARTPADASAPMKFVYASSIAVLGSPLPSQVDDTTSFHPQMSYGAHKLIGEILIADFNRRGWLDGRTIRLPGIVARPPQRTGQLSAFVSDIIRDLAEGRDYTCPIAADSTSWLMSVHCAVDNLLHAARIDSGKWPERRWTLPALRASMDQLVRAIAEVYGDHVLERITYQSNPALQANFGRYPPLITRAAEAAGFRHDGDLPTLVRRALQK